MFSMSAGAIFMVCGDTLVGRGRLDAYVATPLPSMSRFPRCLYCVNRASSPSSVGASPHTMFTHAVLLVSRWKIGLWLS